jgi:DNA primase
VIPESFKRDLLNRVDIVDIIQRHMQLKKAGANFSACCPFHSEKTPSFTVSQSKQFYHCFGCGAHGDAIGFLMEYSGLGYIDALKDLASSAGMTLPDPEPRFGEKRKEEAGPDLYDIMQRARQYYFEQLKVSPRAIEYLKGRGLSGQIAAHFGIGFAPDGWQNLQAVFPHYDDKSLKDTGLVIDNESGKRYDRFRDRIMFPIENQRGFVIGFGGRIIDAGEPKYLNSPETPLFQKGNELYGLPQARLPIREAGRVLVVEGYMDVVALAQLGVEYAVATLGTATTPTHVQKLLRQTEEIVFSFDGDGAGRKAAWRALEVCLPLTRDNKMIRFLFLPEGEDPDSYIRANGKQRFEKLVGDAKTLSTYMMSELRDRADANSAEGRARLITEAKPLVRSIAAPALQLQLVKQVAEQTGMKQEEVEKLFEFNKGNQESSNWSRRAQPPIVPRPAPRPLAQTLLRCVLLKPELVEELEEIPIEEEQAEARILSSLKDLFENQTVQTFEAKHLIDHFRGSPYEKLLNDIRKDGLFEEFDEQGVRKDFTEALRKLKVLALDKMIKSSRFNLENGQDTPEEREKYTQLIKEHTALRQSSESSTNVV